MPPAHKTQNSDSSAAKILGNNRGIAIFMVIASVAALAMLVSEFVYIAQISQSIAFSGLDQTKAHYLAKSGLKLSLLRLKAYQIAQKNALRRLTSVFDINIAERLNFNVSHSIPSPSHLIDT
jgi:hypothetical protein